MPSYHSNVLGFRARTPVLCVIQRLEPRRLLASALGLTTGNELLSFDTANPGTITATTAITGLQPNENIRAIDFRPATGALYGLGSTSRLYLINRRTGAATQVGTGTFAVPLSGDSFDLDFNPQADRIRVVGNDDFNLRLNPNTGAVVDSDPATDGIQPDGELDFDDGDTNAGEDPIVVGAAYTNNFPGATSTTLFVVDAGADALLTQGSPGGSPVSPNTGTLFTVGSLGINVTKRLGFDIESGNGIDIGWAVFQVSGQVRPALYSVNLTTGNAALLGRIGTKRRVSDVAIVPPSTDLWALTTRNELVGLFADDPAQGPSNPQPITGLQSGELILAIDYRPATEVLYGLGSTSRLYTIDPLTGVATQVGSGTFAVPLKGISFDMDFNPAVDRIRVVSNSNQNLRLNPDTGTVVDFDPGADGVQPDADLAYASGDPGDGIDPVIVGAAYLNNFPGTTSTTLFDIDSGRDVLAIQGSPGGTPNSPNLGQLTTVGPLGVDVTRRLGFDIASTDGINRAIGLFQIDGTSTPQLYGINLATGAAALIGNIGGGRLFSDIAILPR